MTLAKSQTENLGSLFIQGLSFRIPPYQRKYSWGIEQAQALWDDICDNYRGGKNMDHYVGTLCLLEEEPEGIKVQEVYEIIDGQQRITTLYLLLRALFEKHKDDIHNIIGSKETPRLVLSGEDDEWFQKFFFEKIEPEPNTRSQRRIKDVYEHFSNITASYEQDEIEGIIRFMQKHLTFLVSKVEDHGQAIKMFSSINDRGLPLKNLDKVKSILMLYDNLYLDEELNKNINDRFESIFRAYDELFYIRDRFREDGLWVEARGLLSTLDEDTVFIHHYMSSRDMFPMNWNKRDSAGTIYSKIKLQCEEERKRGRDNLREFISNYIDDFAEFVNSYNKLIESMNTDETYERMFKYMEVSGTLYPLVIRLYMVDKLKQLISLLETIEIRIYKLRHTNPITDAYEISSDISGNSQIPLEKIKEKLIDFCQKFASDDYFRRKLNEEIYSNPATKYLIYTYNQQDIRFGDYKNMQKEHIFPGNPDFDISNYGFDKEGFAYDQDRIGNITLLEKSINQSVANKAPVDKAEGYLKSDFKETKNLGSTINKEKTNFNKAKIDKRGEEIIDFCLKRFKID